MSDEVIAAMFGATVAVVAGVVGFGALSHVSFVREWTPAVVLSLMFGAPLVALAIGGFRFALAFAIGQFGAWALLLPLSLGAYGLHTLWRRRRGRPPAGVGLPPPARVMGRAVVVLRPGVAFYRNPLWTRWGFLRERVERPDGVVEVRRGDGQPIADLLDRDELDEQAGPAGWYEVYETGNAEWPALVVHAGAAQTAVMARTSSIRLARRIVARLTATMGERGRRAVSPRFWFRTPL